MNITILQHLGEFVKDSNRIKEEHHGELELINFGIYSEVNN